MRSKSVILDIATHSHPGTNGRLDQLIPRAVEAKLEDARENLRYWTACKASATDTQARSHAAARVLIWTGEVAACQRRLQDLPPAAAATA